MCGLHSMGIAMSIQCSTMNRGTYWPKCYYLLLSISFFIFPNQMDYPNKHQLSCNNDHFSERAVTNKKDFAIEFILIIGREFGVFLL